VRAGRARTELSAVFLDRDGVINRKAADGEYVRSWRAFEFLPGALEGLRLLARSRLRVIVVTNQRGIALGRIDPETLADIHERMRTTVATAGARIDAVYHCPHDVGCRCRKPEVGMFEQAARELQLRLSDTAVVGDQPSDMLAAARIGSVRVLIEPPGRQVGARLACEADYIAANLADAARWLLSD
jgi:D-glycero-D-manno-heptose 1,7-bisphosphate phosphatase